MLKVTYFQARNDATSPKKILIVVSVGCEFERTLAAVVYHARSLIWHLPQKTLTSNALPEIKPSTDKEDKEAVGTTVSWRERWYDGLGYCKSQDKRGKCHSFLTIVKAHGTRLDLISLKNEY